MSEKCSGAEEWPVSSICCSGNLFPLTHYFIVFPNLWLIMKRKEWNKVCFVWSMERLLIFVEVQYIHVPLNSKTGPSSGKALCLITLPSSCLNDNQRWTQVFRAPRANSWSLIMQMLNQRKYCFTGNWFLNCDAIHFQDALVSGWWAGSDGGLRCSNGCLDVWRQLYSGCDHSYCVRDQ